MFGWLKKAEEEQPEPDFIGTVTESQYDQALLWWARCYQCGDEFILNFAEYSGQAPPSRGCQCVRGRIIDFSRYSGGGEGVLK
jgi:hypothetical protein